MKLSKIFKSAPTVAFRRKKTIGNFLVKTDIAPPEKVSQPITTPCGKCKFCTLVNQSNIIKNETKDIKIQIRTEATCHSKGVIYAARCKKHNKLYIGKTSETIATRFSKHKYDIQKRPSNNELASHFHTDHTINEDLDVLILEKDIKNSHELSFKEDTWICRLQTLQPNGLNVEHGYYAAEMYNLWTKFYNDLK